MTYEPFDFNINFINFFSFIVLFPVWKSNNSLIYSLRINLISERETQIYIRDEKCNFSLLIITIPAIYISLRLIALLFGARYLQANSSTTITQIAGYLNGFPRLTPITHHHQPFFPFFIILFKSVCLASGKIFFDINLSL